MGWTTEREVTWLSKASGHLGSGDQQGQTPWAPVAGRGAGRSSAGSLCWDSRVAGKSGTGAEGTRLCPGEPGPGRFLAKSTQDKGCPARVGVLGAAWLPHAPVVAAERCPCTRPPRPPPATEGQRGSQSCWPGRSPGVVWTSSRHTLGTARLRTGRSPLPALCVTMKERPPVPRTGLGCTARAKPRGH